MAPRNLSEHEKNKPIISKGHEVQDRGAGVQRPAESTEVEPETEEPKPKEGEFIDGEHNPDAWQNLGI